MLIKLERNTVFIGQAVFAKVLHFRFWPGRIVEIRRHNVKVSFFGGDETRVVPFGQCVDFAENDERLGQSTPRQREKTLFESGVDEAKIYIQERGL